MIEATDLPVRLVATIRVKSDSGTQGLAHSIIKEISADKLVVVQAVGPNAVNLAAKGIAAASQHLAQDPHLLALSAEISFQTGRASRAHIAAGQSAPPSILVFRLKTEALT